MDLSHQLGRRCLGHPIPVLPSPGSCNFPQEQQLQWQWGSELPCGACPAAKGDALGCKAAETTQQPQGWQLPSCH